MNSLSTYNLSIPISRGVDYLNDISLCLSTNVFLDSSQVFQCCLFLWDVEVQRNVRGALGQTKVKGPGLGSWFFWEKLLALSKFRRRKIQTKPKPCIPLIILNIGPNTTEYTVNP